MMDLNKTQNTVDIGKYTTGGLVFRPIVFVRSRCDVSVCCDVLMMRDGFLFSSVATQQPNRSEQR